MAAFNFDMVRYNNMVERYKNEISYIETTTDSLPFQDKELRIKQLKQCLEDTGKEQPELNKLFDMATKNAYKKKWSYLTEYHKNVKLNEFITAQFDKYLLDHKDETVVLEKFKAKILKHVESLVSDKKVNTKNHVIYDSENEVILEAKFIAIDIAKKEYTISL